MLQLLFSRAFPTIVSFTKFRSDLIDKFNMSSGGFGSSDRSSTEFSDVSEEPEIQNLIEDSTPNTKRWTNWGVRIFKDK